MPIFLSLLTLWLAPCAWALGPNDVSLLLPLPKSATESAKQLSPAMAGEKGALLPRQVFSALPQIVTDLTPASLYADHLKVVAIRFDPCFREAGSACQRQVRLVWQPVLREEGEWTTLDGAIHTFYLLNDPAWRSLVADLSGLPRAAGKLQVHPALRREGYEGASWPRIRDLVLRYAGSTNLIRATAMTVNPLGNVWFFSGVNVAATQTTPMKIPRTNDITQAIGVSLSHTGTGEFRVAMNPAPTSDQPFLQLLKDSRTAKTEMSENDQLEAVRAALVMENPRLSDPGTVDCVSCHVAQVVPTWALGQFPTLDWETTFSRELFRLAREKKPSLGSTDANVLRAFGYFGKNPIISRRVANETRLVVDQLKSAAPATHSGD